MRGGTAVASVRSWQKLPLCPREPMPCGSKTDLSLAKTELLSNDGNASQITEFKDKNLLCDKQTATPFPHSPVLLKEEEIENLGEMLSLGRREGLERTAG